MFEMFAYQVSLKILIIYNHLTLLHILLTVISNETKKFVNSTGDSKNIKELKLHNAFTPT